MGEGVSGMTTKSVVATVFQPLSWRRVECL